MAERMQQRRGTSEQWTLVDPILASGEVGYETDTNKFKIGNGIDNWSTLSYFLDENAIGGSLEDYVLASTLGQPNGVATLDVSGKLTATQLPDVQEITEDLVDGVLVAGNGITKVYDDNAGTIIIEADTSVLATKAELAEVAQDSINDAFVAGDGVSKTYNDSANTLTISANLGNGLQIDGTGQIEIDNNIVATQTDLSTDIATHSSTTSSVHGVTGDIVGTSDAQTLTNKVIGSGTTLSATIDANGNTITDLAAPTNASDAATKSYVDAVAEGLHIHASVDAATTASLGLSTPQNIPATIDGVTIQSGMRILVKNQTNAYENGIYVVTGSAPAYELVRATDYNSVSEIDAGDFVFVSGGTLYANTGWVQTNSIATLETDPIAWSQFSGTGTYTAGTGLNLNGTEFSVDTTTIATQSYVDTEIDSHTQLTDGVHGTTGSVVGTTDSQTLTNKTLGSGTVLGANLDGANTYKITNLQDPTSNQDAATKAYVDTEISSIDLSSISNATISNSQIDTSTTFGVSGGTSTVYFADLANASSTLAYSTDLTSWTSVTMPSSANWSKVASGGGKLVSVASGTSSAAYSTNGTDWTLSTLPSSGGWQQVAYGNGKFVAVGSSGLAAYSTDGVTWTASSIEDFQSISDISYTNNLIVLTGRYSYGGRATQYSTNGITWSTAKSFPSSAGIVGPLYFDGKYVALADNNYGSQEFFNVTSLDSNWSSIYKTPPASLQNTGIASMATNGSVLVFVGSQFTARNKAGYITSLAGEIQEITLPSSQKWKNVIYDGTKFIALAYDSTAVATSTDGITWTAGSAINSSGPWNGMTVASVTTTSYLPLATITSDVLADANAYTDSAIAAIPPVDFTGYATETYVSNAVSNLVDSAPATLDTLNELAAALSDDANFATTVTNAIANKQDIVSGVSSTEIGYLDGVTSNIQAQLNSKADTNSPSFTGLTDFQGIVDFSDATVLGIDALPSQTGNAGKYLTTDGTNASWAEAASPIPHPFAMMG